VTLINDSYRDEAVVVSLIVADQDGAVLQVSESLPVSLPGLGTLPVAVDIKLPDEKPFVIYAARSGEFSEKPVYSRRKVGFAHPGVLVTLPESIAETLAQSPGE
jgi:hypothetical protein